MEASLVTTWAGGMSAASGAQVEAFPRVVFWGDRDHGSSDIVLDKIRVKRE